MTMSISTINNGNNANKIVDFIILETEWQTYTEFPCLAGSVIRILREDGTSYALVKKSSTVHSVDQFVYEELPVNAFEVDGTIINALPLIFHDLTNYELPEPKLIAPTAYAFISGLCYVSEILNNYQTFIQNLQTDKAENLALYNTNQNLLSLSQGFNDFVSTINQTVSQLENNTTQTVSTVSDTVIGLHDKINRSKGVICFGDSRAANEYYESPTVIGRYVNNCGILNWANAYLYQSLRITYKGVAGNTYADLVNRYDSDIAPLAASNLYLYVICSINDVLANKSSAQIIADMESLYTRAIQDNLIVIEIADYHPSVGKELTASQRVVFNEVQRYKKIIAKLDNFIVIDSFVLIGNITSTTPNVPTSKVFDSSTSGIHINAESACVIGKKLATELAKQITVSNQLVSTVTDTKNTTNGGSASSSNIISNSLFIGTAGTRGASNVLLETTLDSGYTAAVASLWNIKINSGGGTCYTSVGPGIDGIGFSQRMRIAGTTVALETYQMSLISAQTSLVVAGKNYQARCLVKITACVALHTVMLRIVNTVSGTVYQYRAMSDKSPQNGNLTPGTYMLETPVCDNLSVAPSNFEVQVLPIFSAAGGSATIDISQLECIQLP